MWEIIYINIYIYIYIRIYIYIYTYSTGDIKDRFSLEGSGLNPGLINSLR